MFLGGLIALSMFGQPIAAGDASAIIEAAQAIERVEGVISGNTETGSSDSTTPQDTQPQDVQPHLNYEKLPQWAASVALADIKSLPPERHAATRYLWLRNGTKDELTAVISTVNHALSRVIVGLSVPGQIGGVNEAAIAAPAPITPLAGGRIVRLDLSLIATKPEDFANLLATWERLLQVDSDFTATVVVEEKIETVKVNVTVPKYKHTDGKFYTQKFKTEQRIIPGKAEKVPAVHVFSTLNELRQIAGSLIPIIDSREFNETALTTLDGGLYYEFRGLPPDITLAQYLKRIGAADQHSALFADPQGAISSDTISKAVISISRVTKKPRMVAVLPTTGVRPTEGPGNVAITFDPLDDNRDPNRASPIRNLSTFRGDGLEVIATLPSNFHEFTIWDGTGKLVRSAPDQLVADNRIPDPHTQVLQPAMSCIRCHGDESGWNSFENVIPLILAAGKDIYGERNDQVNQQRNVELLAGMYEGDFFTPAIGPLAIGQLTYDRAIFRVTGVGAAAAANVFVQEQRAYAYTDMDTWEVARELGVDGMPANDGDPKTKDDWRAAVAALRQFIDGPTTIDAFGKVADDGVVTEIVSGIAVTRRDYESCAHLLHEKISRVMAEQAQQQQQKNQE